MPGQDRAIIAVHYFYLLKDDNENLRKLWLQLTSAAALSGEGVAANEPAALPALTPDTTSESERCSIMHCSGNGEIDLCLAMLRNLAVIEVIGLMQPDGGGDVGAFMDFIDAQRRQALAEGVSLFGETTLIVARGSEAGEDEEEACLMIAERVDTGSALQLPGLGEAPEAAAGPSCRRLVSALAPELCGGGVPRLTQFPRPENSPVDYFVLRAADPERMVSTLFPELDSSLKELERAAAFFREQRGSIIDENSKVDKQVSALLHRQVVSMDAANPDTSELESRIADLSRMFGLLATDSLMTRQAEKRLEKDLGSLRQVLSRIMSPDTDAADGIGDYHLGIYGTELEAIHTVSSDLDHSRQNAEAAIDVVRTQIELLRAEEESEIQSQTRGLLDQILKLQEEGMALQVAAGLIEFVLIFYYVLISWEHLLGIDEAEHISPIVRLIPVAGIAAGAALGTHFLARSIKNRTWRNPGLWISAAMLFTALVVLVILSISTLAG